MDHGRSISLLFSVFSLSVSPLLARETDSLPLPPAARAQAFGPTKPAVVTPDFRVRVPLIRGSLGRAFPKAKGDSSNLCEGPFGPWAANWTSPLFLRAIVTILTFGRIGPDGNGCAGFLDSATGKLCLSGVHEEWPHGGPARAGELGRLVARQHREIQEESTHPP